MAVLYFLSHYFPLNLETFADPAIQAILVYYMKKRKTRFFFLFKKVCVRKSIYKSCEVVYNRINGKDFSFLENSFVFWQMKIMVTIFLFILSKKERGKRL